MPNKDEILDRARTRYFNREYANGQDSATNPEEYELKENGDFFQARRDLMTNPENRYATANREEPHTFFSEAVCKALALIESSDWPNFAYNVERAKFKRCVRAVWDSAKRKGFLVLERLTYQALLQDGNGGLRVDEIIIRLWHTDTRATFHEVRDALEHLCILYVVERQGALFSIRNGMLEV